MVLIRYEAARAVLTGASAVAGPLAVRSLAPAVSLTGQSGTGGVPLAVHDVGGAMTGQSAAGARPSLVASSRARADATSAATGAGAIRTGIVGDLVAGSVCAGAGVLAASGAPASFAGMTLAPGVGRLRAQTAAPAGAVSNAVGRGQLSVAPPATLDATGTSDALPALVAGGSGRSDGASQTSGEASRIVDLAADFAALGAADGSGAVDGLAAAALDAEAETTSAGVLDAISPVRLSGRTATEGAARVDVMMRDDLAADGRTSSVGVGDVAAAPSTLAAIVDATGAPRRMARGAFSVLARTDTTALPGADHGAEARLAAAAVVPAPGAVEHAVAADLSSDAAIVLVSPPAPPGLLRIEVDRPVLDIEVDAAGVDLMSSRADVVIEVAA